jgi:hypothetical protein
MFDFELDNYPANHSRPDCIAVLSVYPGEQADMQAIRAQHGPTQIIDARRVPIIPVKEVYVQCQDAQTARALDDAWWTFTETSPHRPHSMEEALVWGEQFNPFPYIPRDWTC